MAESSKQKSSQSYLKMVQELPAKLPRNLVPNPDGQPRVDPVTVDPQNRGRNRNRMNEAENNETKFQQKLHFSKNFFFVFFDFFFKNLRQILFSDNFVHFVKFQLWLEMFSSGCFWNNWSHFCHFFNCFGFYRGTRKYQQSTISAFFRHR